MDEIVKADGMLGNPQPDGAGLTCCPPPRGFSLIDSAALARIDWLTMLGLRPFPLLLEFAFAAETQIRLALIHQPLGMLAVDFQTLRLAIGSVGSTDIRPLVPVKTKPLEIGHELILNTGFAAFAITILDAQHHGAALLPGEKTIEQSRARIANVEMPGRGRSKANPDRRI